MSWEVRKGQVVDEYGRTASAKTIVDRLNALEDWQRGRARALDVSLWLAATLGVGLGILISKVTAQ